MNRPEKISGEIMDFNQVSKMLAYSFVSELIENKKIKKRKFLDSYEDPGDKEFDTTTVDSADMSFGDLESYYKNVLSVIENTPEIRTHLVSNLTKLQEEGVDLNKLYPTSLIVKEGSLKKVLFMDD